MSAFTISRHYAERFILTVKLGRCGIMNACYCENFLNPRLKLFCSHPLCFVSKIGSAGQWREDNRGAYLILDETIKK